MRVVIFDIDGCIADDTRRIPLINWKSSDPDERYDPYHKDCGNDPVCNAALLAENVDAADRIAFLTSRPCKYRTETVTWLKRAIPGLGDGVKYSLFMRDDTDVRSSLEVKRVQLARLSSYGVKAEDVIGAFDDRKDVIEMYKQAGIACARQVAIHPEDSYAQPADAPELGGQRPAQLLRQAARTFEQRNSQYGGGYKRYGALIEALFPPGGTPPCVTPDEITRLNLIMMCAAKLHRYATNFDRGGHSDSVRDLQVYAAMLEEYTNERPGGK